MSKFIKSDGIVKELYEMVEREGNQKKLAEKLGISEQYLSDVLNGHSEPGESIYHALGYVRVVTYAKTGDL
jgi:transcriptional regulator with XRE-family HTH domain